MISDGAVKSELCCQAAANLVGRGSPFAEIIAIEFYDGPVSGLARCSSCRSVLQYKLLAWDERQEKRVFALAKMPSHAWDQIITLYSYDQPRFPVWAPKWVELPKDELEKQENALLTVFRQREEWSWIALMSRYLDVLIDFRLPGDLLLQIEEQAIYGEPKWQWLELFGLTGEE
jgi:hypothetical protein